MKALIDADTPVISVAFVSEDIELNLAKVRLDIAIKNIIQGSGCDDYALFVSGGNNFRKDIDPEYKANRKDMPQPKWREDLRQHLIKEWGAVECVDFEADDMCGVEQRTDGSTCIVGIDKDLLQVPGLHYSWPIVRKGVVVSPEKWIEVSEEQGWRNLFTQALTGDVTDNIKGIYGVGKVKAAALLADCKTEQEMYDVCLGMYEDAERYLRNLDLLYIWRQLGITYSIRREIYGT